MTESAPEHADNPRLLAVAAAISAAVPVDWRVERRRAEDSEQTAVMEELQALEALSRVNEPVPLQWGPFTIAYEIGRGSFGTVYRAVDQNLQLDVALKIVRREATDATIDTSRALAEARLLAQINHSNVVRVYRAEQIGEEVGVAMELLRGHTLEDLVSREGPRNAGEALLIGRDLCHALAAVHGAGLLHGDIKARNVMRVEGGRTVLMDFGAGKDLKRDGLADGIVAGTPAYLAPELFDGHPPTRASDIYSLGVLVYYLATGSYPFDGRTFADIERQRRQHVPRRALRDLRPDLPSEFIRIVDKAIAEKPSDRFQSAGAFEAAIDRASRPVPRPVLSRGLLAAAILIVALVSASVGLFRILEPSRPETSAAGTNDVGTSRPEAANGAAASTRASDGTYRIDAVLQRAENGTDVPLPWGARVAPGDRLSLQVHASVPTYIYVVNEDEQGESYLLFPLPGEGLTNPLPSGKRHRLPGVWNGEQIYWQVTSAGGREHFLIFASPEPPSPAFERMFAALPRPAAGKPIVSHRLSAEAVAALRGIGGLASTPVRTDERLRMTPEFGTPLSTSEEVARGIWVRQIMLENPGK